MSNDYQPTARLLSIKEAGWIEVGDSRVFLCDALDGLYSLREQLIRETGGDTQASMFYRAGYASIERLMDHCLVNGFLDASEEGLRRALGLLTTGGYGLFTLEEARIADGWARITVHNSIEGWMVRRQRGTSGFVCDYTRGMLRGVMQQLMRVAAQTSEAVECAEIGCVSNGDSVCSFVIGTPTELRAHGYRVGGYGQTSVRETLLRLNRQLEDVLEAAQRDALTETYNRAHFDSALQNKVDYANRRSDTLSVVMIDVDGFKKVNDTYGHSVGDMALQQVSRVMLNMARETDVIARYGGDEFAWLMPGTSAEAAVAVAERVRREVQDNCVIEDISLTLSMGIASYPDDAKSLTSLVDVADQAMYRAKSDGGNRVRRWTTNQARNAPDPFVFEPGTIFGQAQTQVQPEPPVEIIPKAILETEQAVQNPITDASVEIASEGDFNVGLSAADPITFAPGSYEPTFEEIIPENMPQESIETPVTEDVSEGSDADDLFMAPMPEEIGQVQDDFTPVLIDNPAAVTEEIGAKDAPQEEAEAPEEQVPEEVRTQEETHSATPPRRRSTFDRGYPHRLSPAGQGFGKIPAKRRRPQADE